MGRGTSLVYQAVEEELDPERKEHVVQVELDGNGNGLPRPVERNIWSEGQVEELFAWNWMKAQEEEGHPPFMSCQDHRARLVS